MTTNAPKGGFVNDEQCNLATCTAEQDPTNDKCNPDDGYVRAKIYKTYSLTCPEIEANFNSEFYFPWDHHGNWHVGSTATLKCLPGYVLPKQYQNGVPTYITNWSKIKNDKTCGDLFVGYDDDSNYVYEEFECDPNSNDYICNTVIKRCGNGNGFSYNCDYYTNQWLNGQRVIKNFCKNYRDLAQKVSIH